MYFNPWCHLTLASAAPEPRNGGVAPPELLTGKYVVYCPFLLWVLTCHTLWQLGGTEADPIAHLPEHVACCWHSISGCLSDF